MSDAINVFDISRLGDAGCDEIWVRIEDLKPLLSRAGLALVPAADVYELQAAQEQLTECVRALELEKSANANLQKVIDALSAAQTADVPTPEERRVIEASLAFPEHFLGSSVTMVRGHHQQLSNLSWAWEQAVLRLHEARLAAKEAKGG